MDEKVLKGVTLLTGLLTLVMCITLPFFPQLRSWSMFSEDVAALLEYDGQGQQEAENSAEELTGGVEGTIEEGAVSMDAQLEIQVPEGMDPSLIKIENNYLTQTVSISFPDGMTDYFAEYGVKGSSDHIASITYYKQGTDGVLAFELDKVYELTSLFVEDALYLDFTAPRDIYDKIIVVDAGHGGKAPGAVKAGVKEKDIDLAILLELKELLDAAQEDDPGIKVYYTRTDDSNPSLESRANLANAVEADLFISIHNNSSNSGQFSSLQGTQVLYSESYEKTPSSRTFAQICLEEVVSAIGSRSLGLVKGDKIYIIRSSEVPVALIEVGFMTNREELDKLKTEEYQEETAQGIYNAIMRAYDEGF